MLRELEISPVPPSPETELATPLPSASPVPSLSPTETALPTLPSSSTPTPTLEIRTCPKAQGTLEHFSLNSTVLGETLEGTIYLPPCYQTQRSPGYPALYLLHGIMNSEQQWLDLGLPEAADQLIQEGEIMPLLVVMPREENWDLPRVSSYGQAVVEELVPWVEEHFHASPAPGDRALGGISRGGNWALRLGFLHGEMFAAVGAHSAPVFAGDVRKLSGWVEELAADEVPRFYLDIGADDQGGAYTRQAEQALSRMGVVHDWHLFPGTHNQDYWRSHLPDYLRWYGEVLNP